MGGRIKKKSEVGTFWALLRYATKLTNTPCRNRVSARGLLWEGRGRVKGRWSGKMRQEDRQKDQGKGKRQERQREARETRE